MITVWVELEGTKYTGHVELENGKHYITPPRKTVNLAAKDAADRLGKILIKGMADGLAFAIKER